MKKLCVILALTLICIYPTVGLAEHWQSRSELRLVASLTGHTAFVISLIMIACGFCVILYVVKNREKKIGKWVIWVAVVVIFFGIIGSLPITLSFFGINSPMVIY